jgi:uncharacterized membrane protein YkgB
MLSAVEHHQVARGTGRTVETVGGGLLRYGLVLMLLSSGLTKFTPTEALFIQPLVGHSPLMAWLYGLADVQAVSNLIGVVEIGMAALLALHRWRPHLAAVGGVCGAVQFLITVSFMFTTPNPSPEMLGAGVAALPVTNDPAADLSPPGSRSSALSRSSTLPSS